MKQRTVLRRDHLTLCLAGAALLAGHTVPNVLGNEAANPYLAIVERNPFGLKPPPPVEAVTNAPPPAPPSKVVLTGITSLFGAQSAIALLEIEEADAGKQKTLRKPILRAGERDGSVEVLSIDIDHNLVRIRNGDQEAELTFEKPKPSPAPGAPGAPPPVPPPLGAPTMANAPAGNTGPIIITRDSSQDLAGGGVHVMGGSQPQPLPTVTSSAAPAAASSGAFASAGSRSSFSSGLPSRSLRSNSGLPGSTGTINPTQPAVSTEEAYLMIEAMRKASENDPRAMPLPPTPLTRMIQEGH